MTSFLCLVLRRNEVCGLPPLLGSSRVTKLHQILTSLYVVLHFAREVHTYAYHAFAHVMLLVHDINVVH
jgi:hypothetical protein